MWQCSACQRHWCVTRGTREIQSLTSEPKGSKEIRMHARKASTFLCIAVLSMGCGLIGCQDSSSSSAAPQTPGEKTEQQGKMIQQAGEMRQKGEDMMVEAQGKRARGEQMLHEGRNDEGNALTKEGDSEVAQAQSMIRQAEQMRQNAFQMPVTTRPSKTTP